MKARRLDRKKLGPSKLSTKTVCRNIMPAIRTRPPRYKYILSRRSHSPDHISEQHVGVLSKHLFIIFCLGYHSEAMPFGSVLAPERELCEKERK